MRFIDEAKIRIAAGHGGPGCVSFRRETFVPRGGPNGGDGGKGGDISFVADVQLSTLQDFRFKRVYAADNGNHGSGSDKAGRDGDDIEIPVPVGTVIRATESGEILYEFMEDGEKWMACKGGRGGKGNAHFVSSTFQAPKFAQPGEAGEFKDITMELKLLADAAIIGFPNAGKSTLISVISAARPKIADYAFTTLTPNLGVVAPAEYQSFVVADVPGLIEGAHRGMGLGTRFLKHIERTQVLIHLMDGIQILEDATKPKFNMDRDEYVVSQVIQRYQAIRTELELFNPDLLHKPEIIAINKSDVLESDPELLALVQKSLRQQINSIRGSVPHDGEPYLISAAAKKGIAQLVSQTWLTIQEQRNRPMYAAVKLPDDIRIRR